MSASMPWCWPGYDSGVAGTWERGAFGVMALPSGRLIRGRGLRAEHPCEPDPEFAVYLLRSEPYGVTWEHRWVDWPDFALPSDPAAMLAAMEEAWRRSAAERVEVGCMGGRGRTGTALACLAILDGVPAADAVCYVRKHYSPDAVETREQVSFVAAFGD